jgi:hypothetical protein
MYYLVLFFLVLFSSAFAKTNLGIWSEWTSFKEIPQRFEYLQKSGARLHLAIKKDELSEERFNELVILLKQAEENKITYWLWPLLSKSDGYWPNQWNMSIYTKHVMDLVARLQKHQLKPQGISIDLEPPPEKLETFLKLLQDFKLRELHEFANKGIDEKLFQQASGQLISLHHFLKTQHITTHVVTTPFILEQKYTQRLQRVFGIPINQNSFDYISFMAYRSEFERIIGEMNSRLVYEYGLKAKEIYGKKAGIDLGVVGNIEFPHKLTGYSSPTRLWEDMAAAKAAGINDIQIYCLEGINSDDWLKEVESQKPFWSFKFFITHTFLEILFSQF